MPKLIAIGYDDEAAAALAERDVRRLAAEGVFEPAGVTAVSRARDGRYARAGRHGRSAGRARDTVHGLLALAALGSRRPLLGAAVAAAAGAVLERRTGIDRAFEQDVRDRLAPGESVLFLAVDGVTPDEAIEPLSRFGGTVLESSLSREARHELEDALRRPPDRRRAGRTA